MNRTALSILAAASIATAPAAFAAAPNLVTNGSFEANLGAPANNWSYGGTGVPLLSVVAATSNPGVDPFASPNGSPDAAGANVLEFLSTTPSSTTTITQTINNLVVGQRYWIGLDAVAFGSDLTGSASLLVNMGGNLSALAMSSLSFSAVGTWIEKITTFTATSTSYTLGITETNNAQSNTRIAIDRVFVTAPEPSSMAVFAVGALGLWRMRRRKA